MVELKMKTILGQKQEATAKWRGSLFSCLLLCP